MGDGGSLFLGGSLAMLAVFGKSPAQSHVLSALAGPVLLLLIPIFDTTFVTMSRLLSGRAASIGGRDHTSHRLVALGFSERRAVLILYALAALAVTAAVLARRAPEASVVGPVMVIVVILLGLQLARVRVYDGMDYSVLTSGRFTPLLVNVAFKRRIFEMLLDAVLVAIAYYASYVIRFGAQTPLYAALISRSLPLVIAIQVLGFFSVGVYRGTWRYISLPDLSVVARGVALGVGCSMLAIVIVYRFDGYSRSVFVIDAMLVGLLVAGARLSERIVADAAGQERRTGRRALLYGAGDSGVLLVRELRSNPQHLYYPVAFLDDDAAKEGRRILGVPVVGGIAGLDRAIVRLRPDALIISTRRIAPARLASVHRVCRRAGTPVLSFECSIQHAAVPGHAGLAARHMP
jgi:UDP-GlcNAc:undecaprenyl-phosphate GlcNAc-1-phosphate transferase